MLQQPTTASQHKGRAGNMLFFNVDDGFLEAEVRGYRGGILKNSDYANFAQCETLDDMKLHFPSTDYGEGFLQSEPSPLQHTAVVAEKCTEKLVNEFKHLRAEAVEPLATFLDYITYGYMIDNIILLITGTIHERDTSELLDKCHPLGVFDAMSALPNFHNVSDMYHSAIVDTPLAPYFAACLSEEDLTEVNIEIIRNKLWKAYLEDFYLFCKELGGTTAEIMCHILEFEADRRAINITINSFGTELRKEDREHLYANFGQLVPEGVQKLARADDLDQVKAAMDYYSSYRRIFTEVGPEKSLENAFFQHEVELHVQSFLQQMHYGVFYSYVKLKEQEIRNLLWIAECIAQGRKNKINQIIPIF